MEPPGTISSYSLRSFFDKHQITNFVNSYFIGICTALFPSIKSLSIFESTLAWQLSISSKAVKLGKSEITNLANFVHRLSKSDSGSNENISFIVQRRKFEEKIEYWFQDFGAMKDLFPSFTSIQWFHIGSFMATQTSLDLFVLLSIVEPDFSQANDLDEQTQENFLKSLLEINSEILKKSTRMRSFPKLDIEKLKKDIFHKENQEKKEKENLKPSKKQKTKPKTQQNTQNTKPQEDKASYLEALNKMKSAVVEQFKENEVISTNDKDEPIIFTGILKKTVAECSICLESAEENSLTSLVLCQHSFHWECLQQYLKINIDERNFPLICPMEKCCLKIFGSEIPSLLDEEYKKKFNTYSFQHYIDTHPDEYFQCPGVDCKSVASRKDAEAFYCKPCKKTYCMRCCRGVHPGLTCEDYANSINGDKKGRKFKKWMRENSCQQCSSCHSIIQRTGGCNHMTCRCRHSFCYLCGATWKTCSCK